MAQKKLTTEELLQIVNELEPAIRPSLTREQIKAILVCIDYSMPACTKNSPNSMAAQILKGIQVILRKSLETK